MRLLFLASRFPYPPLKGDQVRAYHQLRLLSRRHEITLISFGGAEVRAEHRQALKDFCSLTIVVPLRQRAMLANLARAAVSRRPLQTLMYASQAMWRAVRGQIEFGHFDLAHVQLARMAPYLQDVTQVPRVIDLIDALSLNMTRRANQERGLTRFIVNCEGRRLIAYETTICRKYEQVTVVSATDRTAVGAYANVHVNANGVDLTKFPYSAAGSSSKTIVFSGNMGYFPNVRGTIWFIQHVFPLVRLQVPNVRFQIVGAHPHRKLRSLVRDDPAITLTGYVPNIHTDISRAGVSIAPLFAGSGMQFKILEAMASGTPVVATPLAVGGLDVACGNELVVARSAEEFADAVVRVLQDPNLRDRLARRGRALVEQYFTWEHVVAQLEDVYELARSRHGNVVAKRRTR